MHVTVIGADGGMGQWLTRHLTSIGHDVSGFDERKGDNPSILANADLVIVSVPVGETATVIRSTIKHMRHDAAIMEIASLKTGIHEEMVKALAQGFNALCVHPMFGPSVTSLKDKTVAVIPVSDAESEKKQVKVLFPEASIVAVDAGSHDRLMSLILSLPYMVNLALAGAMKDEDLNLLRRLSGTSFALQYTLIQSVSSETTSLVHALLHENKYLQDSVKKFLENLNEIMEATESRDQFNMLHLDIKESMRRDRKYGEYPNIRQAAYDSIQRLFRGE